MRIAKIVMEVGAGDHVVAVSREAVKVAVEHGTDVEFTHNDKTYLVEVREVYACCKEKKVMR